MPTARYLRQHRARAIVETPHGGHLYVKHLPRKVKKAVKKHIVGREVPPHERRRVESYLAREGKRDQSHRFRLPKARWGPGPWQDEPDRLEFTHAGLSCLIVRNLYVTGSLNGYVGVTATHPWWGKGYGDCIATPPCGPKTLDMDGPMGELLKRRRGADYTYYDCDHQIQGMVTVHGGVTYAGPAVMLSKISKIKERELWWFGFDTGHAGDITPMMEATLREMYRLRDPSGRQWAEHERVMRLGEDFESYKDLAYVRHEVEQLAEQIALASQVTS